MRDHRLAMVSLLAACVGAPTATDSTDAAIVDSGSDDPCPEVRLELGIGTEAHTPLAPNARVTLVHGPQNGWHIDLSGVVDGMGSEVAIDASVRLIETGQSLAGEQPTAFVPLMPTGTCTGTFVGARQFVDDVPLPKGFDRYLDFICTLQDAPLQITATVSDLGSDREARVTVEAVAALDKIDKRYECP